MDESKIASINDLRERTILDNYGAMLAELKQKVRDQPLKTKFYVYSGCVSKEICQELAHRITFDKISTAKVCKGGLFRTYYYLEVTVKLPEHLIREGELNISQE